MPTTKEALQQYFLGLSDANTAVGTRSIGTPHARQRTREFAVNARGNPYRRNIKNRTEAYLQNLAHHVAMVADGKYEQLHHSIQQDIRNLQGFLRQQNAPQPTEGGGGAADGGGGGGVADDGAAEDVANRLKTQAIEAIPEASQPGLRAALVPDTGPENHEEWAKILHQQINGTEIADKERRDKILTLFALHQIQQHLADPENGDKQKAIPREFRSPAFMVSGFSTITFTLGQEGRPQPKASGSVYRLDADIMTQDDGLRHVPLAFNSQTGKLSVDTNGLISSRKRSAQWYGMRTLFKSWASMVLQGQITYKGADGQPVSSPAFIPQFNGFKAEDNLFSSWFLSGSTNETLQKIRKATVSYNVRDAYLKEVKGLYQEANRLGFPIKWAKSPYHPEGTRQPNPDYCRSYGLVIKHIMPPEEGEPKPFADLPRHVQTLFLDNADGKRQEAETELESIQNLMRANRAVQKDIDDTAANRVLGLDQAEQMLFARRQDSIREARKAVLKPTNRPTNSDEILVSIQEAAGDQATATRGPAVGPGSSASEA